MSQTQRDQAIFHGLIKQAATTPSMKTDQQRFEIDLTTAHSWEEIPNLHAADFMIVESIDGTAKVHFNEPNGPEYDLTIYRSFVKSAAQPIERVYLYNVAQAGKTLKITLGGDASFSAGANPIVTLSGNVGVKDTASTQINPSEMASTPILYTKTCASANTEYSQALPAGTKKFMVKCRDTTSIIRLAFVTGKVATPTDPYLTIQAGASYWEDFVKLAAVTLYVASPTAGAIVEIVDWS